MRRRSGNLIDPAAKKALYILSYEKEKPIVNLANAVSKEVSMTVNPIVSRIEGLIEIGLVNERIQGSMRLVSITEKGKDVVKILKKLDKVMEE